MSSDFDRYMRKMDCVDKARKNKSVGFQGCRNHSDTGTCKSSGYYGCNYSIEGLCTKCEIKEHPERFHGCYSCRKIIPLCMNMCPGCELGFDKWAFDLFYNKNERSKSSMNGRGAPSDDENNGGFKLWLHISRGIHNQHDSAFDEKGNKMDELIPAIGQEEFRVMDHEWPGFYCGENKWIQLNPFELKPLIDIHDINEDNRGIVIKRELNKLGIFLHKSVQYVNPVALLEEEKKKAETV